jgi:pimeloyl-ACP methyl ester carboxylesterase
MVEVDYSVSKEQVTLKGTICLPQKRGKFPVVLMIHGSGELDRDENQEGLDLNIFNNIAHYLAENGIASIRYDKRGCGQSTGDFYKTGHFDLVDDALTWFDELKSLEFVNLQEIYLLGHSEGCIIAPQINIKRKNVAGMILLCPFTDQLEDILMSQAESLHNELIAEIETYRGLKRLYKKTVFKLFDEPVSETRKSIKKIKRTSSDYFVERSEKVEAKWFREIFTIVPTNIFNKVSSPILAISGSKDLQCKPQDIEEIKNIAPVAVETHILPNLTHILRCENEEPCFSNYPSLAKEPLDTEVLNILGRWLKSS